MNQYTEPPQDGETPPPPAPPSKPRLFATLGMVVTAIVVSFVMARDATSAALIFAVILIGLVVAHEFAHFLTAKLFGVYVLEFGIGFPPKAWGFHIGETEYTINWLPLGGFVRLLGEEDPTHPRSLASHPRWQRFIVLASGSVMNLILPIVLFAFAFTIPHQESVGRAIIAEVVPDSPAAVAGLQQNDIIYSIGGRNAKNSIEAGRLIRLNLGHQTDIVVKRAAEFETITVTPRWTPPSGQGPTGIRIAPQYGFTETVSQPPWESLPNGLRTTFDTMILARNEFISWFKGGSGPEVAGPVAIAQTTGEVARDGGISPLLELSALLSINLGIMNLLPLPMLDGGRVFFLLIEVARRGRRIAPEKEAMVHLVGFVLFLALAVVVTFADVSRIVNGDSLFR
jgi:regulator of sigma E protease